MKTVAASFALGVMAGSMFTAGITHLTPTAHATPDGPPSPAVVRYIMATEQIMCQYLDDNTTPAALDTLIAAIQADGFTTYEAAEIIVYGVMDRCPQHENLLQSYINQHTGPVA